MDFIKLLRSLEELLFEALSWLVFYPKTVWRMLVSPLATMDYSDLEQVENVDDAYSDTLSPGFFLIVTLLLLHGVELARGQNVDMGGALGDIATQNDQNLLVTRSLMFGMFPLIYAVLLLVAKKQVLDRNTLRAPFFAQCYLAGLFALLFNLATNIMTIGGQTWLSIGALSGLVVVIHFVVVEALWLRREAGIARWRAAAVSLLGFAVALTILAVVNGTLLS